jgi:hypothetical protein
MGRELRGELRHRGLERRPVREQIGLRAHQAGAASDQPEAGGGVLVLGDLRFSGVRVVNDACQSLSGIWSISVRMCLCCLTAIKSTPRRSSSRMTDWFSNP